MLVAGIRLQSAKDKSVGSNWQSYDMAIVLSLCEKRDESQGRMKCSMC